MTETVALSFWLLRHRLRTVEKLGDDKLSTSRNHMLKMNLWILLPLQLRYEFEITSICFIPMHDDWTLLGVVHLVYMLSTCLDSFYTCLVLFWWWLSFWLKTAHMLICFIFRISDQFEPLLFECLNWDVGAILIRASLHSFDYILEAPNLHFDFICILEGDLVFRGSLCEGSCFSDTFWPW